MGITVAIVIMTERHCASISLVVDEHMGWVPGSIGKTIEIFPLVLLLIRSHADHITLSHLHSTTSGGTDVSLQGYARLFTIPSHLPWGVGRSCTKELCTSPSISMDTAGSNLHQTRFTPTTPRLRTFVEYYMDGLRQVVARARVDRRCQVIRSILSPYVMRKKSSVCSFTHAPPCDSLRGCHSPRQPSD